MTSTLKHMVYMLVALEAANIKYYFGRLGGTKQYRTRCQPDMLLVPYSMHNKVNPVLPPLHPIEKRFVCHNHHLVDSLLESPPKRSIFLLFVMSEWYRNDFRKKLLLLECPVWSAGPMSPVCLPRMHLRAPWSNK